MVKNCIQIKLNKKYIICFELNICFKINKLNMLING